MILVADSETDMKETRQLGLSVSQLEITPLLRTEYTQSTLPLLGTPNSVYCHDPGP